MNDKFKVVLIGMLLVVILVFTSCSGPVQMDVTYNPVLSDLPEDYSLEQAKKDNCVVYENLSITSGQKVWDQFCEVVDSGGTGTVRLGFYYEKEDADSVLYIKDLTYDGTNYTMRWFEDGKEIIRTYKYMNRSEGKAPRINSSYDEYSVHFITNESEVTWEDIQAGMLSSQAGAYIDHCVVYMNFYDKG